MIIAATHRSDVTIKAAPSEGAGPPKAAFGFVDPVGEEEPPVEEGELATLVPAEGLAEEELAVLTLVAAAKSTELGVGTQLDVAGILGVYGSDVMGIVSAGSL